MLKRRPLRVACVAVAVLLGVLAMHALSTHGVSSSVYPSLEPVASLAQADVPAGAAHTAHAQTPDEQHRTTELCVALLVGLGLAALLRTAGRDRAGHLVRRARSRRLVGAIRAHRPPALTPTQLCILRC